MAVTAPVSSEKPAAMLRYLDVAVLVVAAPIMILIGVPAVGYLVGMGAWIVLRFGAVSFDRWVAAGRDPRQEVSLRLVFLLSRLFLLALAVILVRNGSGRDAGLTTLLVIVFAYTLSLAVGFLDQPGRRR